MQDQDALLLRSTRAGIFKLHPGGFYRHDRGVHNDLVTETDSSDSATVLLPYRTVPRNLGHLYRVRYDQYFWPNVLIAFE